MALMNLKAMMKQTTIPKIGEMPDPTMPALLKKKKPLMPKVPKMTGLAARLTGMPSE